MRRVCFHALVSCRCGAKAPSVTANLAMRQASMAAGGPEATCDVAVVAPAEVEYGSMQPAKHMRRAALAPVRARYSKVARIFGPTHW